MSSLKEKINNVSTFRAENMFNNYTGKQEKKGFTISG